MAQFIWQHAHTLPDGPVEIMECQHAVEVIFIPIIRDQFKLDWVKRQGTVGGLVDVVEQLLMVGWKSCECQRSGFSGHY